MPFTKIATYPCNPVTERGVSTKLSVSKDKVVYTNGRTVIFRDLNNPSTAFTYAGHPRPVSVAKISPTGYYCASADINGTVRVWDTIGEDNTTKGEYNVISGRINDLSWDGESKRIIAVGAGKELFGKPFSFDTGTSTGEISGHSKAINAVSIRYQRPFRAVTASDDMQIVFFTGVPFKYSKTIRTHSRFVQDVRYSNNGDFFASVGSDSKIFLYDGKTGDTVGEFDNEGGHKGSIMACSWSPDDKTLATSSMDGTVKLWDVETRKNIHTCTLGTGVNNQQVGNAWAPSGAIISLSMSGDLNVFDNQETDKPSRVLSGPQKAITSGTITPNGTFLAGTADGRIVAYDASGEARFVESQTHTSLVTALTVAGGAEGSVLSVGFDDQLREVEISGASATGGVASLGKQPKSVAASSDGTAFVTELQQIEVYKQYQKIAELAADYGPNGVDVSVDGLVAVGGDDNKVHLYNWDGQALTEDSTLDGGRTAISSVSFSPDGTLLVAGESAGRIVLYNVKDRKILEQSWTHHSGRITSFAWTASGTHIASGSLDTHVYVWSIKKPNANVPIRNANAGGVNFVGWTEGGKGEEENGKGTAKLLSAGADACARVWEVQFIG